MKTFFKQVLAVVVGMLIVSAFTFLMGFIMLGAMLSAGDSKPVIKDGSVLRIDLSGNLQERVQENPVSAFLGMSGTEEQGLDNILKSIKIAATNDKISGIYLESGIFSADMASLEEIRKALTDFKKKRQVHHCLWRQLFARGLLCGQRGRQPLHQSERHARLARHRLATDVL